VWTPIDITGVRSGAQIGKAKSDYWSKLDAQRGLGSVVTYKPELDAARRG
jgi:hypothetical protein